VSGEPRVQQLESAPFKPPISDVLRYCLVPGLEQPVQVPGRDTESGCHPTRSEGGVGESLVDVVLDAHRRGRLQRPAQLAALGQMLGEQRDEETIRHRQDAACWLTSEILAV